MPTRCGAVLARLRDKCGYTRDGQELKKTTISRMAHHGLPKVLVRARIRRCYYPEAPTTATASLLDALAKLAAAPRAPGLFELQLTTSYIFHPFMLLLSTQMRLSGWGRLLLSTGQVWSCVAPHVC